MTIVTKPLTAFKEKKDEADAAALVSVETKTEEEEKVSVPGQVQRLSRTNHVCLVLSLAVMTLMGLMVGLHVYRSVFMKRVYCGTYRIPLNHGVMPENTLVAANFQSPRMADDPFKMDMFALFNHEMSDPDTFQDKETIKEFEFDVELDMENNVMETLELPEIFLGRYMHDFKINQTVIVDTLAKRCFLMKLDRSIIPAPRSIYEILAKMRNGAFDIDYQEIRKSYRITGPPVKAFDRSHGAFIPDVCSSKITYNLEEMDRSHIVKRDVGLGSSGNKFGEFVGENLITYDIVNINQI